MRNLKLFAYLLLSVVFITSCSNNINDEIEGNNTKDEVAEQQNIIYDYYVDADSLVVNADPKVLKWSIDPSKPGNGGDTDYNSKCWCVFEPTVYYIDINLNVGEAKTITFYGAERVTFCGVGGGLMFGIANGVGTLRCIKKGVYTNFQTTTWWAQCPDSYCQENIVKYRINCDYFIE